ncbi:hypothetical protein ACFXGR_56735 [Streptomyces mirabilis]|uniref:hypothetical protein n=1 Tax=Streptomyces mirabilis TaxID=68239 RepID=UPI0036BA3689
MVDIFPDSTALTRLVGAVLAEQIGEWTEACRCMGLGLLTRVRLHPMESETDETFLPTESLHSLKMRSPSGRRYTTPTDVTRIRRARTLPPCLPGLGAKLFARRPDRCMGW